MSDDPRNSRKDSIAGRFEAGATDKEEKTEKADKTDKTEQTEAESKTDRPSTKDKTALTMYLAPETIKDEDIRFQELNLEYQREYDQKLQKNADYWPAVFEAAHSNQTVREILELDD